MTKLDDLSLTIGRIEQKIDNLQVSFNNHLVHHDYRYRWAMGIISALIVGVILFAAKLLIGG